MNRFFRLLMIPVFAGALMSQMSCEQQCATTGNQENVYHVIPAPANMKPLQGRFPICEQTQILYQEGDEQLALVADYLAGMFTVPAGFTPKVQTGTATGKNNVLIQLDDNISEKEGYHLQISPEQITITAKNPVGAFYAVQTIRQLLPSAIESGAQMAVAEWSLPCVEIEDAPRFVYRGLHLDVGRHFFPVEFIKKYIDMLAMYKMNTFHWHLTEDQGWRIEIKKYPKLTEIGGFRKETLVGHGGETPFEYDGKRYGGFYTQEEIKEVVNYAQEKFVTIIPEIELPGHAQAALTAYPQFSCTGGPIEVVTRWGVFQEVFCPKEETFQFLEDVLSEVIELFPSKYIHIGGDECPKDRWKTCDHCQALIKQEGLKDEHELQSYFIRRIEKFLNSKDRNLIGWDEILEGGLAPNATVMSWRGEAGGIEAAKQGHDVIMSPNGPLYLDHYQSKADDEPLAIGGFTDIKEVYEYDPMPEELQGEAAKHILGAQGNVWTEYMQTSEHVEYMVYPRMIALAEVNWSPKAKRNWEEFTGRLGTQFDRLKHLEINYAPHFFDVTYEASVADGKLTLEMHSLAKKAEIYYTLDGSEPNANAAKYESSIVLEAGKVIEVKAATFKEGAALGKVTSKTLYTHLGVGKEINLDGYEREKPAPAILMDGQRGAYNHRWEGSWIGFRKDLTATVDLQEEKSLSKVVVATQSRVKSGIYPPSQVEVLVSADGKSFSPAGQTTVDIQETGKCQIEVSLEAVKAKVVKVILRNPGIIEEGKAGAGKPALVMLDEIVIL
ncbi:glycoside hydrolase family 20 protein [Rapidithrix thailandica]|uniref:beta-N-acetylhexosaminidase n=1 Tax=Rapidithrix thailandica TaxID=413964 RepID=A0AAW9S865_9BACT